MFGKIEGQNLNLAKMRIANYCSELENEAGAVNVGHVVTNLNERFKIVPKEENAALVNDISKIYECFNSQQVESIDRGSYWKWKASTAVGAKIGLEQDLESLRT